MYNDKENKKGFTLIEIIVIVTILAVLMSIAVPSIMKYIDEGNLARDIAFVRGAKLASVKEYADSGDVYNKEPVTYIFDSVSEDAIKMDNQTDISYIVGYGSSDINDVDGLKTGAIGKPKGQCVLVTVNKDFTTTAQWGKAVISQATIDAKNFPVDSNEYKILMALPLAQQQALANYQEKNLKGYYAYSVIMNTDGTFTLSEVKNNAQSYHYRSSNAIMKNTDGTAYVVVVGQNDNGETVVGTNLHYYPDGFPDDYNGCKGLKIVGVKWHVVNNSHNNYAENINFDYH